MGQGQVPGLNKGDHLQFLNECPFDCGTFAVSGKVWCPQIGLTTTVGKLWLLQLTVLSRSAFVVQSTFWLRFLCPFDYTAFVVSGKVGNP